MKSHAMHDALHSLLAREQVPSKCHFFRYLNWAATWRTESSLKGRFGQDEHRLLPVRERRPSADEGPSGDTSYKKKQEPEGYRR